jgi:hypothetical protein
MVFNATYNDISVLSRRSVLLVEETRILRENHRPSASHWQIVSHNVVSSTPHLNGIRTNNVSGDKHWLQTEKWHIIIIRFNFESNRKRHNLNGGKPAMT